MLRTKLPMRIEVRSTSPGVTDPAIKVEFVDRDSGRTKAQDEIKVFEFFDADGKFLQNAFSKRVREILGELRAADDRKHS